MTLSSDDLDAMLNEAGNQINFTLFLTIFGQRMQEISPSAELQQAFETLEELKGKEYLGKLNKAELKRDLMENADRMTEKEVTCPSCRAGTHTPNRWTQCSGRVTSRRATLSTTRSLSRL